MLVFLEEGKKEVSRKKSLRARDRASNKPHIESTARIWTWTTFFGGDCSSHCATLAPLSINLNKSINYCSIFLLFSAISKPPDNTDECSTSPCQNSGTCVNRYNDYICQCADGYHGKNCETGERYIKERNERMFWAMSTWIQTFSTAKFYMDLCERGLKTLWTAVSKQSGFGDRIHWFRKDARPIRVKKYAV